MNKTYIAVIDKAVLGTEENPQEAYIFTVESGKAIAVSTRVSNLVSPENMEMFVGHLCKLYGEMVGLVFVVKSIESMDDPELVWYI